MCQYSLEINISSSFLLHFGQADNKNLKISHGQLAPCQENRIKRQQTVSFAGCKVLVPNACFLLASMPSYCRFKPIQCSYSESVSVSVPQDKIRGSAIAYKLLAANCSQLYNRVWQDSQLDRISTLRRRLCLASLCNSHFFKVSNSRTHLHLTPLPRPSRWT